MYKEKEVKKVIFVMLLGLSFFASATDINCRGTVPNVMDYPSQCDGNLSFTTSGSNGKWICPPSEKGNSILLTAFAASKEIGVYINDQDGTITCETMPHYTKARYVFLIQ